ncbi:unnamed protein product [Nesidiocoris tenuis]|uniref:Uncharacterized protein n=1 Tax=Nesidiocoris tenuis TaxID=355587 RepID=A0A6H5G542_9HEMI|nr:unnamed protein product [Nesidiocoris tenuis]
MDLLFCCTTLATGSTAPAHTALPSRGSAARSCSNRFKSAPTAEISFICALPGEPSRSLSLLVSHCSHHEGDCPHPGRPMRQPDRCQGMYNSDLYP